MASQTVFATIELFELVLLNLPMADLLLAQAVNRSWKAIIETSPVLQKALFLQPASPDLVFYRDDLASHTATNSVNARDGHSWRVVDDGRTDYYFFCPRSQVRRLMRRGGSSTADTNPSEEPLGPFPTTTTIYLNPLLLTHFPWFRALFQPPPISPSSFDPDNTNHPQPTPTPTPNPHRFTDLPTPSAQHPSASWRRMLITQPPLGGLTTRVRAPASGGWGVLRDAVTVRLALLKGFEGRAVTMERLGGRLAEHSAMIITVLGTEGLGVWRDGRDLEGIGRWELGRGEGLEGDVQRLRI